MDEIETDERGAPDEVWLQLYGEDDPGLDDRPVDVVASEVTWCWHRIFDSDVKYVREDLVDGLREEVRTLRRSLCDIERYAGEFQVDLSLRQLAESVRVMVRAALSRRMSDDR